jgi:hypothetical protein
MEDTIKYKGYDITIKPDECDESPRSWDNAGTMVCFHKRYTLGDKTDFRIDDYSSWTELQEAIIKKEGKILIFPLYLYDHSGLRIKIGSFAGLLPQGHAEFDSGIIGYIYISYKKIREEWGKIGGRLSKKAISQAEKCLQQEVETYDQYLSGDVWWFNVTLNGENVDSCGGNFGYKFALEQAQQAVDHAIKSKRIEHAAKLKSQIRKGVPLNYRVAAQGI